MKKYSPSELIQSPSAQTFSESLRSFGYDIQTAVADLVDNAIAAGATNVGISLADGRLAMLDDGGGMDAQELLVAMRPGSRDPLEARQSGDLGRFGLGLKTASFSQCRCLTVASRSRNGEISCLRWDLDHIQASHKWELLEGPDPAVEKDLALLHRSNNSGTLILWSKCDRLGSPGQHPEVLERIRSHLGLVFHRFIGPDRHGGVNLQPFGEEPVPRIEIRTTLAPDFQHAFQVKARDPVPELPATNEVWRFPRDLRADVCRIRAYVLPHQDKFSADEFAYWGGRDGWNQSQGIYLYRCNRILVAGGWLGLNRWRQEPETRLARVIVDFDNASDSIWAIDVKKSRATPPETLRHQIIQACEAARKESFDIFTYRRKRTHTGPNGQHVPKEGPQPVWLSSIQEAATVFSINEQHPLMKALKKSSRLAGAVFRLIERELPRVQIWQAEREQLEGNSRPTVEAVSHDETAETQRFLALVRGMAELEACSEEEAFEVLRIVEPFCHNSSLIEAAHAELFERKGNASDG